MYNVLIIGGGVSGVSCSLVLGSAQKKAFMTDKRIGIIAHQKASSLQEALINNAYGIKPGTLGSDLLNDSLKHLSDTYPHIDQIEDEKVLKIEGSYPAFTVHTNKNSYQAENIVVCIGSANTFMIEGLMEYATPHQKSLPEKNRIQLTNNDQKVADGIYVAGTLAGHRSQVAIASGSGAAVATDLLTFWNDGIETHSHDSIKK